MARTLYIGLGGLGGRVVFSIKKQMERAVGEERSSLFVAIDSDALDLDNISKMSDIPCINLRLHGAVRDYVGAYKDERIHDWLPRVPYDSGFNFGMGMIRVMGRLAFFDGMRSGKLEMIDTVLHEWLGCENINNSIRVLIVTSLAGGMGSGSFIPVALWIRKHFREMWNIHCEICGFFAGAEVFIDSYRVLNNEPTQTHSLRANTYAALRELEFITSIKTGTAPPATERFCIDDLFDSAQTQDGLPVYDEICIYDVNEEMERSGVSINEHICRMAEAAYLRYSSDAGSLLHAAKQGILWNTGKDGLNITAVGTSVAQYPKEKIVRYCALRAAHDLVANEWNPVPGIDESQEDSRYFSKVDQFIKDLHALVEEHIRANGVFEYCTKACDRIDETEDLEAYSVDRMRWIEATVGKFHSQIPSMCDHLMRQIAEMNMAERGAMYSLSMDENNHRYLSCATVKALLHRLKCCILEEIKNLKNADSVDFHDPGPVPFRFGKKDIAPSEDVAFPLVVLQNNHLARFLQRKRFGAEYMMWFADYCKWNLAQRQKQAVNRILSEIYPMIIKEVDAIFAWVESLNAKLLDKITGALAENLRDTAQPDVIKLCATREMKEEIYAHVSAYENASEINRCYWENIWAAVYHDKLPEFMANGRFNRDESLHEVYTQMIHQIETSILETSAAQVDLEAVSSSIKEQGALALAEGRDMGPDFSKEIIEQLCCKLRGRAAENMRYTGYHGMAEDGTLDRPPVFTLFGVSRDCEHLQTIRDCLRNMPRTGAFADQKLDKSLMWCMQIAPGMKLDMGTFEHYAEAYRWPCERARQELRELCNPHIDKRFVSMLNGD